MKAQVSLVAIATLFLHAAWINPIATTVSTSGVAIQKINAANPSFSFFRTHRQGPGIMTTWGLTSNEGVSGFIVEKTYEDPNDPYANWEIICSIPCGSIRSYKHHDLNVSPGFISYRVTAYLLLGGSLMSLISTEHIVRH